MVLLFIGVSGSGKDTQAELLSARKGFSHISTGEILRTEAEQETPLAQELNRYMQEGWVPDNITYEIFAEYLLHRPELLENAIFTGAVRTLPQVKLFDDLLTKCNSKLDYVIDFELNVESAIGRVMERQQCSLNHYHIYHAKFNPPKVPGICDIDGGKLITRNDDNEHAITNRHNAFQKESAAIINEYKQRNQLIVVDASPSIDQVYQSMVGSLKL